MTDRYIAFDVETPNARNHRMSAIGVTVIEDGAVTDSLYTLVNPETWFDSFNVMLTGITPEMASAAPTFPALWEKLEPMLSGGLLVAHNAPFDMSVLARCLLGYGIRWKPYAEYACTCQMGRRLLPDLPNHRLNTICEDLGIELDHHNAGSDSRACGEILLHCLRCGADVGRYVRLYDLAAVRTLRGRPGAVSFQS